MITSFRSSISVQRPGHNRVTVPASVPVAIPPHAPGVLNTWLKQYAPRGMR